MSIRSKTWLILAVIFAVLAVSLLVTARLVILKGYEDLEITLAGRNITRAKNVLKAELDRLNTATGDYSAWDATYNFVNSPNNELYTSENFVASSFANINIQGMLFFNAAGSLVSQAFFRSPAAELEPVPPEIIAGIMSVPGLLFQPDSSRGVRGIMPIGTAMIMAAARPILKNDYAGPSRGTLVFLRYIDSSETARLSDVMNLPVSLAAATDTGEKSPADFAKSGSAFQINAADRDHLNCYERIPDLTGQNSLILSLISTREISRYGRQIYVFGIIWIAVIIILISAALLFTLEKTVLSRLSWLRRAIDAAGGAQMDAGSMSRIRTSGHDEVAAVADDINRLLTAIEQTTERAEKSEQEYKLLFDKMQSGFAVHEIVRDAGKAAIDYRFLDVNPAFEKLTGLAREAVIGRTARELLPGLEPLWIDRYGRVVQTGQPDHFEEFNASLDKHFDVMAFRTGDNRFAVTFTDITERKKAEAERAQAQQDLAQIQKMEVVGQLASGVAHDFNNQMTSVLGYADLLRDELAANRDFTRARFAENIIKGIERARDLTKQLLAFARKGKNRSEPVDMHDVIIEVVGMLKRSLDKNILLVKKLDAASAIIMGDRNQLQNVILNIAINASDAMPAGGQLTFATTTETLDAAFCERYPREVTPGRYLRISITDTGTGIDAETAKHIFEPFFTTKPPGKGTGMGLAAALGTVKHHRGIITVDSAPLSGSAFNIYLPACEEKIIKGEATRKIPAIPGNPHLLVVDDEETVAEVARELLEKMGCEVTHCRSGREAIEYYSKSWQQINLVILDIMMPEMNGKEVLPLLIKINPEVRVIVSSGYSMNEDAQAMIRDGAIDFLQKPYRSSTLSAAIIGALKT